MANLPAALRVQGQTPVAGHRPPSSAPLPNATAQPFFSPQVFGRPNTPQSYQLPSSANSQSFAPLSYPSSPPPAWSATHHRPSQGHANLPYPDEDNMFPTPSNTNKEQGQNNSYETQGPKSNPTPAAAFAAIPASLLPGSPPTRPHSVSLSQTPAINALGPTQRPHGYSQPPRPLDLSQAPPPRPGSLTLGRSPPSVLSSSRPGSARPGGTPPLPPKARTPGAAYSPPLLPRSSTPGAVYAPLLPQRSQTPAAVYNPPKSSWAAALEQQASDTALARPPASHAHSRSTGSVPFAAELARTQTLAVELEARVITIQALPAVKKDLPARKEGPPTTTADPQPARPQLSRLNSRGIVRSSTPSTIVTNEHGVTAPAKTLRSDPDNEDERDSPKRAPAVQSSASGRARAASDLGNDFGIKANPWVATPACRTPAPGAALSRQPSRAMRRQLAQELESHLETLDMEDPQEREEAPLQERQGEDGEKDEDQKDELSTFSEEEPELLSASDRTTTNDERTLALLDLYFATPDDDHPGLVRSITRSIKTRSRNTVHEKSQLASLVAQLRSTIDDEEDYDDDYGSVHSASSMYSPHTAQHPWEDVLGPGDDDPVAANIPQDPPVAPQDLAPASLLSSPDNTPHASQQPTPQDTPRGTPRDSTLVPEPLSMANTPGSSSNSSSTTTSPPWSSAGSPRLQTRDTPRTSVSSSGSARSPRPHLVLKTAPSNLRDRRAVSREDAARESLAQQEEAARKGLAREGTLQREYAKYKAHYSSVPPVETPLTPPRTTDKKASANRPRRPSYEGHAYGGEQSDDDYTSEGLATEEQVAAKDRRESGDFTVSGAAQQPARPQQVQENSDRKDVVVEESSNRLAHFESRHPEWSRASSRDEGRSGSLAEQLGGPVELPSREHAPAGSEEDEREAAHDLSSRDAKRARWETAREEERLREEDEIRAEVAAARRASEDQRMASEEQRRASADPRRASQEDHTGSYNAPGNAATAYAAANASYGASSADYARPSSQDSNVAGTRYRQHPQRSSWQPEAWAQPQWQHQQQQQQQQQPFPPPLPLQRQRSGSMSDALGSRPAANTLVSPWQPQDTYLTPDAGRRGHGRSASAAVPGPTAYASSPPAAGASGPSTTQLQHQPKAQAAAVQANIAAAQERIEAARAEMRRQADADGRREGGKKGRGFRMLGREGLGKMLS